MGYETSDVVQETLIEADRDFASFRGDTLEEFQAWLQGILCHNVQDKLRYHFAAVRDVRRLGWLDDLAASSDAAHEFLAADLASPSGEVEHAEQVLLVADALWELPEHYRAVLVMRHLEGATFGTIAERLGRSEEAVRKLWTRALVRARDRLRS